MKKLLAILAAVLALGSAPAFAQQGNITGAAKIVNTARVPGTAYSYGTRNETAKGLSCTFNQTADVGVPSTVISAEVEDAASGTWQTLGSAAAVNNLSTNGVPSNLMVYPGIATSSLPSGLVGVNLKVGAIWRLKQVITGGTSSTGTATCDLLN